MSPLISWYRSQEIPSRPHPFAQQLVDRTSSTAARSYLRRPRIIDRDGDYGSKHRWSVSIVPSGFRFGLFRH
jgi:hypothetical protein